MRGILCRSTLVVGWRNKTKSIFFKFKVLFQISGMPSVKQPRHESCVTPQMSTFRKTLTSLVVKGSNETPRGFSS